MTACEVFSTTPSIPSVFPSTLPLRQQLIAMEALNRWLLAQSNLKRAASDFLDACTTLKATIQPLASRCSRDTLEIALDQVQSRINFITLVEGQLKESRATLNVLLNMSITRVPINRLPSELLLSIFTIVSDPPKCYNDVYASDDYLTDIRLVCARWNRVVADTPWFWSHIDADLDLCLENPDIDTPPMFDSARLRLERARSVPIHLHFWGATKISENDISALVSIIRPHLTRLNSLTVSGVYTSRLIHSLLEVYSSLGKPGTLKSLSFDDIQERREAFSISWSSLSGLVELDLQELRRYVSPLFSELVALLSNCPTLHTLRLRFLEFRPSPAQEHPMIHLPCLRLLEFGVLDDQEEILHLLPLLSPGVHELDVRLSLPTIDSSRLASHVQPFLERSNVTFLSLQDTLPDCSTQFKSILSSTPRLRALLLHYATSDCVKVVEELLSSAKKGSARPLPGLQCLFLVCCGLDSDNMDRLGRVLAERRLRSLVFWSCTFPSSGPADSDEDEDEVQVGPYHDLEYVQERFSGQVERIVVCALPQPRIRGGIDLSIEEFVND